jgi:hypothetical protein
MMFITADVKTYMQPLLGGGWRKGHIGEKKLAGVRE